MGHMTNPPWWVALAAGIKEQAEQAIALCLHVANTLEGHDLHDH